MVKRRNYYKLFRSFTGGYFTNLCVVPSYHDIFSSTDSPARDHPLMNLEVKWSTRALYVLFVNFLTNTLETKLSHQLLSSPSNIAYVSSRFILLSNFITDDTVSDGVVIRYNPINEIVVVIDDDLNYRKFWVRSTPVCLIVSLNKLPLSSPYLNLTQKSFSKANLRDWWLVQRNRTKSIRLRSSNRANHLWNSNRIQLHPFIFLGVMTINQFFY